MMFVARSVMRSLWLVAVFWAYYKAICGRGFKNSRALVPISGYPLADHSFVDTKWPSPYFQPHALVCPRVDTVFLADQFRVYVLTTDNTVAPYPCDVNGTIADISAR